MPRVWIRHRVWIPLTGGTRHVLFIFEFFSSSRLHFNPAEQGELAHIISRKSLPAQFSCHSKFLQWYFCRVGLGLNWKPRLWKHCFPIQTLVYFSSALKTPSHGGKCSLTMEWDLLSHTKKNWQRKQSMRSFPNRNLCLFTS